MTYIEKIKKAQTITQIIIGIAVFANKGYEGNTVADQTGLQMTEPVAPDVTYGEISTEQIEAGAVEGNEGFETEPVEPSPEEQDIEEVEPADGNPVVEVTSGPEAPSPEPVIDPVETVVPVEPEPVVTEPAPVVTPVYVFRNEKLLNEHYEKHGIEMGFTSAEAYQAAASAVITNPDSLFKIEAEDGDGVYYLEATNEFVILSTDGYIRTYFLPSSGRAYFDRQ